MTPNIQRPRLRVVIIQFLNGQYVACSEHDGQAIAAGTDLAKIRLELLERNCEIVRSIGVAE